MKYALDKTTFSVITAVHNGQEYIARCMEAIINSNYDLTKIEHIVVDDGSTDNTKQICEQYAQKYPHIKFYSKSNGHWGSVMNYVKNNHLAHNDYITLCDSDDILLKDAFKIVNTKNNNADIVATSFLRWNLKKTKIFVPSYFFLFKRNMHKKYDWHYFGNLILPQTGWIKNEIFYQIPDLKEGCPNQDIHLFTYANLKAKYIKFVPKATFMYSADRPNNTRSAFFHEKGLEQLVKNNFKDYEQKGWLTLFFFLALGLKTARKYFKKYDLKFEFKNCRLELTGYPWYMRIFLRLFYHTMIKKFIKK